MVVLRIVVQAFSARVTEHLLYAPVCCCDCAHRVSCLQ